MAEIERDSDMNANSNVALCLHELSTALQECRVSCTADRPAAELAPCFDLLVDGVDQLRSSLLEQGSLERTLRMLALVNDRGSVGIGFEVTQGIGFGFGEGVVLFVDSPSWSVKSGFYWERTAIGSGATLELAAVDAIGKISDAQLQRHAHEIVIG